MIGTDIRDEIRELKQQKNAVLLAHYYVDGELQDLADFVGDSLQLARYAKQVQAERIVFVGVHFMAEVAKILNPHIPVIVPTLDAGCSLADGCTLAQLLAYKKSISTSIGIEPVTIAYINCSAEVKANVDIICTSSNAAKIIRHVSQTEPHRPIFFVPDQYLGTNLGHQLQKEIFRYREHQWPANPSPSSKQMYLFDGSCMVHEQFSARRVVELKLKYPEAKVIAHSECVPEVVALADVVGSTTVLLDTVKNDPSQTFIILTEAGILHQMKRLAPEKILIPGPTLDETCSCNECPFMKKNTLENLRQSLETEAPQIYLEETLRLSALKSLEAMLAVS